MANYPASFDTLSNPTGTDAPNSPDHAAQHGNANDILEAIEAELGLLPKGSHASVVARLNGLPLGKLGYAQIVAAPANFTAEVDVAGLSVAVTAGTGRILRISAELMFVSTVSNDIVRLNIKEGATYLRRARALLNTAGFISLATSVEVVSPSAGAHTYKISVNREVGTGTITPFAGAQDPGFILVEDLGVA